MRRLIIAWVVLLLALHQDFWLWSDKTLLGGFLPIGLAYHAGFCVAASLTMWLLVRTMWPRDLEAGEGSGR